MPSKIWPVKRKLAVMSTTPGATLPATACASIPEVLVLPLPLLLPLPGPLPGDGMSCGPRVGEKLLLLVGSDFA